MKKNTKFIQLGLISIGVILIFSFYLYPNIKNKLQKKTIQNEKAEEKIDKNIKNKFTNVTYNGENSGNPFTIRADTAEIRKDVNLIFMESMFVTIFLGEEKWTIECEIGTYNKLNYNIFCTKNMKATSSNDKTTIYSQNLDFIADESATLYNKVLIIDKEEFELRSDRIFYDFENKIYKVDMFNTNENVKIKLVE